jgi:hypothetical protein
VRDAQHIQSSQKLEIILVVVCVGATSLLCAGIVWFLKRFSVSRDKGGGESKSPGASVTPTSLDEAMLHNTSPPGCVGPGFGFDGLSREQWRAVRREEARVGWDEFRGTEVTVEKPIAARLKS